MSKSVRSDKWFLRVDGNVEFLTQKFRELSSCLDTMELLAVFHLGEKKTNPHAHAVIRTSGTVQKQSFAIRIKTLFAIEKKTQYALDVWDGGREAGAVSYMFHEKDCRVLVCKDFDDDEINKARQLSAEVEKVVAINKQKASHLLVQKSIENQLTTRSEILLFMLKEIKEGNSYHPGMFKLKSFVEEVMIRQCDNLEDLAYKIENELWRS